MKAHLYEFSSKTKKLKCSCGWERTLRSSDTALAYERFAEHRTKSLQGQKPDEI